MNIYDRVDWNFDISIGAEFGKGNNGRVDSDVGVKFGRTDSEGIYSEVWYEVGSGNGSIVKKYVRCVRYGFSVWVGDSFVWGVDRYF